MPILVLAAQLCPPGIEAGVPRQRRRPGFTASDHREFTASDSTLQYQGIILALIIQTWHYSISNINYALSYGNYSVHHYSNMPLLNEPWQISSFIPVK